MGIYLPNMEMPKDIEPGLVIEFADGIDGKRYARLYHYRHGGLTEWLEAVPVPPHGRLGDLDAVERQLLKMQQAQKGPCAHGVRKSRAVLRDTPTIIPAEEE
jgi:hypothetical protein